MVLDRCRSRKEVNRAGFGHEQWCEGPGIIEWWGIGRTRVCGSEWKHDHSFAALGVLSESVQSSDFEVGSSSLVSVGG